MWKRVESLKWTMTEEKARVTAHTLLFKGASAAGHLSWVLRRDGSKGGLTMLALIGIGYSLFCMASVRALDMALALSKARARAWWRSGERE